MRLEQASLKWVRLELARTREAGSATSISSMNANLRLVVNLGDITEICRTLHIGGTAH